MSPLSPDDEVEGNRPVLLTLVRQWPRARLRQVDGPGSKERPEYTSRRNPALLLNSLDQQISPITLSFIVAHRMRIQPWIVARTHMSIKHSALVAAQGRMKYYGPLT